MPRRDRIRQKIISRVEIDVDTGCWLWTGPTSGSGRGGGYGRFCLDGGTYATHKAMWVCEHGPIPPGKQLDHTCPGHRRNCVNPAHLELVAHKENQRRRDARLSRATRK